MKDEELLEELLESGKQGFGGSACGALSPVFAKRNSKGSEGDGQRQRPEPE
jgi:hypothetical protein